MSQKNKAIAMKMTLDLVYNTFAKNHWIRFVSFEEDRFFGKIKPCCYSTSKYEKEDFTWWMQIFELGHKDGILKEIVSLHTNSMSG